MLQIRALFSPGEPVHQHITGSNHTRFNTERQKDHKCMTEVEICEENMRTSNVYLTGVSKETEEIKEENGKSNTWWENGYDFSRTNEIIAWKKPGEPTATAAAYSPQSRLTLCDPTDCSLLDSSVHGSFQARVLEWVATAFSKWIHYRINKKKSAVKTDRYNHLLLNLWVLFFKNYKCHQNSNRWGFIFINFT